MPLLWALVSPSTDEGCSVAAPTMVVREKETGGEFKGSESLGYVCVGGRDRSYRGDLGVQGSGGEVGQREEMVTFLESLTQKQGSRLRCEGVPGEEG